MIEVPVQIQLWLQLRPQQVFDDSEPVGGRVPYFRFRCQPEASIALAARITHLRKESVRVQPELYLGEDDSSTMSICERLLDDAMASDGALFTDQDAVMAAWMVVEMVLAAHCQAQRYECGSGPTEADALIAGDRGWHEPAADAPMRNRPAAGGLR